MLGWFGGMLTRSFRSRPVFVVGLGRSGTTILLKALKQHPGIVPAGGEPSESPLLSEIGAVAYRLSEDSAPENFRHYQREYLGLSPDALMARLRRLGFESVYGPDWGARVMVGHIRHGHAGRLGRSRSWGAKTFPSWEQAVGLMEIFPNAKFIHILRNGVDVVQSHRKFERFAHLGFELVCERWARGVEKYDYVAELESGTEVRHEDLVEDPASFFENIIDFLGLPPDDAPREFVTGTLMHPLDQKDQHVTDAAAVLKARAPAHESWTGEEKSTFRRVCAEAMERKGYEVPF